MRFWIAALVAACFAVVGLTKAFAGAFPDGPGGPNIAIVDTSTVVSPRTLAKDLPLLQLYADQVCQAWHCQAHLYLGKPAGSRDWSVTVNDWSDQTSAIGYHQETGGVPAAFVSVKTARAAGMPWTVVFTHELAEMLVDPSASLLAQTDLPWKASAATFANFEIADPVQGATYQLGHVTVSDFVYRSWFEKDAAGPYDAIRALNAPLTLAPQSWMAFYQGDRWQTASTFGPFLPHQLRERLEIR